MVPIVWFSFILAGFLVLGARAESPQFTSATIRPSTAAPSERGGSTFGPDGSFVATNVTLKQLIETAYRRFGFDRREVVGGPDWVATDRFDLVAKGPAETEYESSGFPRESLRMLQEVLKAGFKVRGGVQVQQRPAYVLTSLGDQASRPRLVRSTADCPAQMRAMARRQPIEGPPCGASPYPGRLAAKGITIADLAALLSRHLDLPVIDATGVAGIFDVDLEAIEIQPKGPFGPSYRPSNTKDSIFNAVVSQLGMKLEKSTAPNEVLVIEHAEKPQR